MEFCVKLLSLPLWERGLKLIYHASAVMSTLVAPLVGAWIEIQLPRPWFIGLNPSLPLWERGLKLH